jgi:signal transduction histidine kinase
MFSCTRHTAISGARIKNEPEQTRQWILSFTGIEMDEKAMESKFKIGRVVSTNGTEGEHGTGFGLLICKDFVEKHGETIRV